MKRILSITVFLCSIFAMAQVSTTRLNDFKLGMKKSELEKNYRKENSFKNERIWRSRFAKSIGL